MADIVVTDTVAGASISETASARETSRRFLVQGVPGNELSKLKNLIDDDNRIPSIGDAHPVMSGVLVYSREGRPVQDDNDSFEIICNYRPYTAQDARVGEIAIVEYGSSLQNVQTNYDATGQLMTVTNPVTGKEQGGSVDLQIPSYTLRVQRKEFGPPNDFTMDFVGTVNSSVFAVLGGSITISQRTGRCNGINATTQDGGLTYDVVYDFEIGRRDIGNAGPINADPWEAVIVATDDATGRPVTDVPLEADNIKAFQIYPEKDFTALNLF